MAIRRISTKPLGQVLLERKLITPDQLEKALEIQKERGGLIGQILVSLGYVNEEQIAHAITVQYGYPYLPLDNYDFNKEVVKIIPFNVAKQYGLVAIDKLGNMLTVAMCNPLNIQAIEDIELLTNSKVQAFVSTSTDIESIIQKCYPSKKPSKKGESE
ncbi:MAG: hypothetical protein HQ579_08710 [Candidatus Omnitrophica bacterium]|nr:hypothetical protein [Candidatus Omnitrophota bacterium]